MRIVLVSLIFVLLVVPAQAERMRGKNSSATQQQQSAEQKKKASEAEKAYKRALNQIPDQKPPDPWVKIR